MYNLTWAAPSSNGGFPITAYKIYKDNTLLNTISTGSTYFYNDSECDERWREL